MTKWLPLIEYSSKYKLSVSTLRRRIRSGRTEHEIQDGKYFLKDAPLTDHHPNNQQQDSRKVEAPPHNNDDSINHVEEELAPPSDLNAAVEFESIQPSESQIYDEAVAKILSELKKAFSLVLQEKEEQVMILKDEVADLHTLVKVLESENERLKNLMNGISTRESSMRTATMAMENRHEMDPSLIFEEAELIEELEIE